MSAVDKRFDEKYIREPDGGCWLWTASIRNDGYGQFKANGKMVRTHRFAYERSNGQIPDGMFICHKCDNPRCVNPDHLFLGTPKDNVNDKVFKGRQTRGETNSNVKLTSKKVAEIRASTGKTHRELAKAYGVSRCNISAILSHKAWVGG